MVLMWCLKKQDTDAKTFLLVYQPQTHITDQLPVFLFCHVSLWQLMIKKRFDPMLNNGHFSATLTRTLIRLQVSQAPLKISSGKAGTSVRRAADPHLWKWLFISGPLICASRCQTAQCTQRSLNGSARGGVAKLWVYCIHRQNRLEPHKYEWVFSVREPLLQHTLEMLEASPLSSIFLQNTQ